VLQLTSFCSFFVMQSTAFDLICPHVFLRFCLEKGFSAPHLISINSLHTTLEQVFSVWSSPFFYSRGVDKVPVPVVKVDLSGPRFE
jgi:hypothetical protein